MGDKAIEEISATLHRLAKPKSTPKELLKAVRKHHPDATKKAIVRAAFYSIIANADADPEASKNLHDFAMAERAADDKE